ncbi:MAG: hypothetical protein JXA15_10680 [Spirochaetales bacterium]|nr:hypothetical protein [Spirochaetales bacterium]
MNASASVKFRRSAVLAGVIAAALVPAGALGWLSGSAESLSHRASVSRLLSAQGAGLGSPGAEDRTPRDEAVLALFPVLGTGGRAAAAAAGVVLARLPEGAFPVELAVDRSGRLLAARVAGGSPAYAATALSDELSVRAGAAPEHGPSGPGVGPEASRRAVDEAVAAFVRACAAAGFLNSEDQ